MSFRPEYCCEGRQLPEISNIQSGECIFARSSYLPQPSHFIMLKFNWRYFAWAVAIFVVEILIARYVHDAIVRPYIGDLLVVVLIYCFVKAFLDLRIMPVAFGVLAFAFLIEALQYFKMVELLQLQNSKLACTVIGTSFSWIDMLCYVLGIVLVLVVEGLAGKQAGQSRP